MTQAKTSPTPADLPDLLRFSDGRQVSTSDDWPARRAELLKALQDIQYGQVPPPLPIDACRLQCTALAPLETTVRLEQHRLTAGQQGLEAVSGEYLPGRPRTASGEKVDLRVV